MNFHYIKTFATAAVMTGAMAFAMPVMAADEPAYPQVELSVNPNTSVVETIDVIEITFEGVDLVEWAVTGTENSPYMENVVTSERAATFAKLGGEGNVLTLGFYGDDEFAVKGEYKVIIPEGSYVFQGVYNGMPGEEIVLNYEVLGIQGVTIEPAVNVQPLLQNFMVTFNGATEVTLAPEEQLGTDNTPYLMYSTEDGEFELRHHLFPSVAGNNLLLHTYGDDPITEPGEYKLVIPGTVYFVDGMEGEDLEFTYTIVAPSYPEYELIVNPNTDVVDVIDTIEITFDGIEVVEWVVTGTENSPYLENVVTGERAATFASLDGFANMLSLGFYGGEDFAVKGEYKVIIPEGSYVFQGIYNGMPGKEIVLNYEVLGIEGVTIEPAVNVQTELQNFRIVFNGASEVTLAEDLGTENTPYLMFFNESGEWERRHTLFPSVAGNSMLLTMNTPIADPGEYKLIIPGSVYFVDGMEGEDLEFSYTVVEDYEAFNYIINPEPGVVESLQNFELTFEDALEVDWNYRDIEKDLSLCPTIAMEGEEAFALHAMTSRGNMLYLAPLYGEEWTAVGDYVLTIPAGSYYIDGEDGKAIVVKYTVDDGTGVGTITVNGESLDIYDLNGRKVVNGADASVLKQLRGIFVVNGKKQILR